MKPLLLLAVAAFAGAQDIPDTTGWSAAKWGITLQQAKDAFPAARAITERDRGVVSRLELSSAPLGRYIATAHLQFDPDRDHLSAVALTVDERGPRAAVFEELKQALADKYGRPTTDTATTARNSFGSRSATRSVQWRLTTLLGIAAAGILTANLDWGKLFRGDSTELGKAAGAVVACLIGYYTNKK